MKSADVPTTLTLARPTFISKQPAWFTRFYVNGSQAQRDRTLFAH